MNSSKEWRKVFKLSIRLGNAAFDNHISSETARILRAIADKLDNQGVHDGQCNDINGNIVGSYTFDVR
jgi:hypothetical protein